MLEMIQRKTQDYWCEISKRIFEKLKSVMDCVEKKWQSTIVMRKECAQERRSENKCSEWLTSVTKKNMCP